MLTSYDCSFVACASAVMLETDVSACLKELFQTHFLPLLDELAQDSVINVRMAVAKLVHALASNGMAPFRPIRVCLLIMLMTLGTRPTVEAASSTTARPRHALSSPA